MWNDFITAARNGQLPEKGTIKQASLPSLPNFAPFIADATKQASSVLANMEKQARSKAADAWFQKMALVDASQMGPPPGGGAPPMDPAMMGGMPPGGAPPMDPAMMGAPPPMDPAMMGGAPPVDPMSGQPMGAPPAPMPPPMDPGMGDPNLMGPDGKKLKAEQIIVQQCAVLKELLYGLYNQFGFDIPISAISDQAAATAIIENKKKQEKEKSMEDTLSEGSRINPLQGLAAEGQKIGSVLDGLSDSRDKLAAINRHISKW
jgi:hypothetical protein